MRQHRPGCLFLVVPDPPGRRGRPRVLLPLTIGGVDAEQAVREFRERSVSACGRPAGSTFYVACDLARDLTMPTANPAVVDRVEEARFRIIVRPRSEEHTSELQSRFDLVCRLLLE